MLGTVMFKSRRIDCRIWGRAVGALVLIFAMSDHSVAQQKRDILGLYAGMRMEQLWTLIKGRPWKCLGLGEDPKRLRMTCDINSNEQITFSATRHLKENVVYAVIYSFRSGRSPSELTDSISASYGAKGFSLSQQQSQATEAALGDNRFVRSLSAWQLGDTNFLVLAPGDREFDPTREAGLAGNRVWLAGVFDYQTFVDNEKSWQSRQKETNPPPR